MATISYRILEEKDIVKINLIDEEYQDFWEPRISSDFDKKASCWYLDTETFKKFLEDNKRYDIKDEDGDSTSEDEESESKTIQDLLLHRLKKKSSQEKISEMNISDSDDEDVVSLCKRMRYLYEKIDRMSKRISELENKV